MSTASQHPKIQKSKKIEGWTLAIYGAIGAIAPDILLFYSKRWTMPSLTFHWGQYIGVTVLYIVLAAFVATIFPYGRQRKPWKAFGVGVSLPVIISGLASLGNNHVINPRGAELAGTFWDLLAFL